MKIKFTSNNQEGKIQSGEQALVVTSLLYLKDAITNERYEECAELIRAAKRFGASPSDIKKAIAEGAQSLKPGRKVEASYTKTARRF